MVFDSRRTIEQIRGHMLASGHFSSVALGEPMQPPSGPLPAVIFQDSLEVVGTTLQSTIEEHVYVIRIYQPESTSPVRNREFRWDTAQSNLKNDVLAAIRLNGTVRNIDVTSMDLEAGYMDVSGARYRTAELVFPVIVDDSSTFVK